MASAPRRAAIALLAALGSGCSGGEASRGAREGGAATGGEVGSRILVSAAASLTDAFGELESAFESAHPGVDVALNLGGSSSLGTQLLEGAPVDVFASASRTQMDRIVDAGLVEPAPRIFATNALVIAVPVGNPGRIRGLQDFADPSLRLGLCAEQVPCGALARQVLARAGVAPALDTNEPNVRALLTKIELGELDAGLTYRTDVAVVGAPVQGIDIPDPLNVTAEYPIAVLAGAPNPDGAELFVRFVLSDAGRAILARHGFGAP